MEVLEQVNPDVALTSSKADEASMDVIRDHSEFVYPFSASHS